MRGEAAIAVELTKFIAVELSNIHLARLIGRLRLGIVTDKR